MHSKLGIAFIKSSTDEYRRMGLTKENPIITTAHTQYGDNNNYCSFRMRFRKKREGLTTNLVAFPESVVESDLANRSLRRICR